MGLIGDHLISHAFAKSYICIFTKYWFSLVFSNRTNTFCLSPNSSQLYFVQIYFNLRNGPMRVWWDLQQLRLLSTHDNPFTDVSGHLFTQVQSSFQPMGLSFWVTMPSLISPRCLLLWVSMPLAWAWSSLTSCMVLIIIPTFMVLCLGLGVFLLNSYITSVLYINIPSLLKQILSLL